MWKTVMLGEVIEVLMGQAPLGKACNKEGIGTPFVKAGEFGALSPIIREWTTEPKKIGAKGDVFLCVVGATCGKINLGADCAIGRSVAALRPNTQRLNQQYLYYFMSQQVLRLRSGSLGAAQTVISKGMINNMPFPLPPLAEQQRIVAKLDAAFAEIDRATAVTADSLANTKAVINASLNEVFVAEGKQWDVVPLADTCVIERGSSPRPIKQYQTAGDGINWIKIGDTSIDGKYVRTTREKITVEGAKKSRFVRRGDFILTNSMSYGRPYIMDIDGCIHDGWFALRLKENIDTEYYYYLLASPYVQNQFHSLAAGAVVKNISSDLVKRAMLPMPPIKRQIEIRNRILEIEASTHEAENCYENKIQKLAKLKSAILSQELQQPQSEAA
jgi:type I restriction enzyme S subunit